MIDKRQIVLVQNKLKTVYGCQCGFKKSQYFRFE